MVVEHYICDGCGRDYKQKDWEKYGDFRGEGEAFYIYQNRSDHNRHLDFCPECRKPIEDALRAALKG